MNSYNRVNSVQMSDNSYLLNDVLRDQWGFDGIVISDWGSVNNRAEGVKSRMNLEMPNSGGKFDNDVYNALKDGTLTEQQLDICVYDLLKFVFFCADRRTPKTQFDYKQAHKIAQSIAKESVVLLKNKDNILPLSPKAKIAVIGQSAELPRFQGGGSAQVNPVMLENPLEELSKAFDVSYSQGYNIDEDILTKEQINEAVNTAKKCDYVVFFAALPDRYESEYFDRIDISLPNNQNELIQTLSAIKPVVVVLSNGSAIEMPWIGDVYAVLETYLLGEACGSVIADILCGKINPSGKLTETFPKRIEDTPSYLSANNEYNDIIYNEDIYVGYKYYEKKKIQPLFPFGYGLSYTTFEYSNVRINKDEFYSDETITLSVDVKNTGKTSGKEIVQLYFSNNTKKVTAPLKQLCDFEKVELAPNQLRTVTFKVPVKEFSVYSQSEQKWVLWAGKYSLCVG
ncbi:MAG: glycoside hydrolase family 3 C-terminal domain-containing protein, partial [Oscillospiraceae bacterium]